MKAFERFKKTSQQRLYLIGLVLLASYGGHAHAATALSQETPAQAVDSLPIKTKGERASPLGYVSPSLVWRQRQIPVCWVNPSGSNNAERAWVQDAIARTWSLQSQVSFTGWGTCGTFNRTTNVGVRIVIDDVRPSSFVGTDSNAYSQSMFLNFTFNSWEPSCKSTPEYRKLCIDGIAIHEFGHALGFQHEQHRPDPKNYPQYRQACVDEGLQTKVPGAVTVGEWDLNSIMNYCSEHYLNDAKLSTTDIRTVRAYYGEPRIVNKLPPIYSLLME